MSGELPSQASSNIVDGGTDAGVLNLADTLAQTSLNNLPTIASLIPNGEATIKARCVSMWERLVFADATGCLGLKGQVGLVENTSYRVHIKVGAPTKYSNKRWVTSILALERIPSTETPFIALVRSGFFVLTHDNRALLLINKNSPAFISDFWYPIKANQQPDLAHMKCWYDEELSAVVSNNFEEAKLLREFEQKKYNAISDQDKEKYKNAAIEEIQRRKLEGTWGTYKKLENPHFSLPKGEASDFGDAFANAKRELKEETDQNNELNYKIHQKDVHSFDIEDGGKAMRLFVAKIQEIPDHFEKLARLSSEYDAIQWVALDDILQRLEEHYWTIIDADRHRNSPTSHAVINRWKEVLHAAKDVLVNSEIDTVKGRNGDQERGQGGNQGGGHGRGKEGSRGGHGHRGGWGDQERQGRGGSRGGNGGNRGYGNRGGMRGHRGRGNGQNYE